MKSLISIRKLQLPHLIRARHTVLLIHVTRVAPRLRRHITGGKLETNPIQFLAFFRRAVQMRQLVHPLIIVGPLENCRKRGHQDRAVSDGKVSENEFVQAPHLHLVLSVIALRRLGLFLHFLRLVFIE